VSTDVIALGARAPDRLACVGVDLTPEERSTYDRLKRQTEALEPRIARHRRARRALTKVADQRRTLLESCSEKVSLRARLSPRSAPHVLFFATGTVEDPRDSAYDGSLDQPRRLARIHQVFPRSASPDAIDAFLDGNDWVPDPPVAPLSVPPVRAITPVVAHNVLPRGVLRGRWWHRGIVDLVRVDDLPPFVRLNLPMADVCSRCGRPVGWMHWCRCPTSLATAG
jgi:hypothetical protein